MEIPYRQKYCKIVLEFHPRIYRLAEGHENPLISYLNFRKSQRISKSRRDGITKFFKLKIVNHRNLNQREVLPK